MTCPIKQQICMFQLRVFNVSETSPAVLQALQQSQLNADKGPGTANNDLPYVIEQNQQAYSNQAPNFRADNERLGFNPTGQQGPDNRIPLYQVSGSWLHSYQRRENPTWLPGPNSPRSSFRRLLDRRLLDL